MCLGILEPTSLLVTVCTLRFLFLFHKCQQENEHGGTKPLYSLHWTLLLYYPLSFLFPLRQLFIIYPAGAINEKNKFCLCWLIQKPHNFPTATAGRKGIHVLCPLEQGWLQPESVGIWSVLRKSTLIHTDFHEMQLYCQVTILITNTTTLQKTLDVI